MFLPVDASLRQFARAVTADRFAGDELAGAVIAEMRRQGAELDKSDRVAAFKGFIAKWREVSSSEAPTAAFSTAELIRGIAAPPPEPRLALLLSDVSGFSPPAFGEILAPVSEPVSTLIAQGRDAVKSRCGRAVIIEDEPLIAADLKEVLEAMGVKVVGLARTAEMGIRAALAERPDIVLADYNLDGRKTGVDAVVAFQNEHQCPVIFITGYPDEVLKGEDVEPDFVLVKPYTPDAVRAAVGHCLDTERYLVTE